MAHISRAAICKGKLHERTGIELTDVHIVMMQDAAESSVNKVTFNMNTDPLSSGMILFIRYSYW
jgi:hypothetical protein